VTVPARRRALGLVLALAVGLAASACGKKNEPEPPSGPQASYGKIYPKPQSQ
jgi:hypothetical protein